MEDIIVEQSTWNVLQRGMESGDKTDYMVYERKSSAVSVVATKLVC